MIKNTILQLCTPQTKQNALEYTQKWTQTKEKGLNMTHINYHGILYIFRWKHVHKYIVQDNSKIKE